MKDSTIGVVMSYWKGADHFQIEEAINSILTQTRRPDSIILVRDGPVDFKIKKTIEKFITFPNVKHVILPENKGRGIARHLGVLECNCDYIALMDSDDLSLKYRLEKQIKFFKKNTDIDLVGGYIQEFDETKNNQFRTVPLNHENIIEKGKFSQPFNHVTIMFKKEIYLKSGGYGFFRLIEDYEFYHRLYLSGSRFANLPEVLVKVRTNGQINRRQGFNYFREELLLQLLMYKSRYINTLILIRNLLIRLIFRSIPGNFQVFLTKRYLRKENCL